MTRFIVVFTAFAEMIFNEKEILANFLRNSESWLLTVLERLGTPPAPRAEGLRCDLGVKEEPFSPLRLRPGCDDAITCKVSP